jgi:hypothetical protein
LSKVNNKIWIGWLAFFFIIAHFSFIFIYALPAQVSSSQLKSVTTPYVEPLFTQTWGMFAPCPTVNSSIMIEFYLENGITVIGDPIAEAAKAHSYLRGSHHGELVLSASNLYYWLSIDLDQMGVEIGDEFPAEKTGDFYEGYSYFKIKNFIRGNGLYLYDSVVDSAIIRFQLKDVVTGEQGVIQLPKFYFD